MEKKTKRTDNMGCIFGAELVQAKEKHDFE